MGLPLVSASMPVSSSTALPGHRSRRCFRVVPTNSRLRQHQRQVGVAGIMTEIRQYRVHLAAMMSLVIEEVRHGQLPRPADFALRAADNPHEVLVQPSLLHDGGPSGNIGVGAHPFGISSAKSA